MDYDGSTSMHAYFTFQIHTFDPQFYLRTPIRAKCKGETRPRTMLHSLLVDQGEYLYRPVCNPHLVAVTKIILFCYINLGIYVICIS
jgi:hypothetical protein